MATPKVLEWSKLRERLNAEMRRQRWGQRQLAEALHVSQPSISKFIHGGGPSPELLWHAAQLLSVPMESLLPDALTQHKAHAALRPSGLQRDATRRLLTLANDILIAVEREAAESDREDSAPARDTAAVPRHHRDRR